MDLQNGFCHGLGNNYTIYTIYSIIKVGVIERYNISMYIEYLFCTIENIVWVKVCDTRVFIFIKRINQLGWLTLIKIILC